MVYNFIISTDLSGLVKMGNVFVNKTEGVLTYFLSSRQKRVMVSGMPSLVKLFVVCFTTNVAGNSGLSANIPFSCK